MKSTAYKIKDVTTKNKLYTFTYLAGVFTQTDTVEKSGTARPWAAGAKGIAQGPNSDTLPTTGSEPVTFWSQAQCVNPLWAVMF